MSVFWTIAISATSSDVHVDLFREEYIDKIYMYMAFCAVIIAVYIVIDLYVKDFFLYIEKKMSNIFKSHKKE